jgi:hypothetical protein
VRFTQRDSLPVFCLLREVGRSREGVTMRNPHRTARRIVVGYAYLLYFQQQSGTSPAGSADDMDRLRAGLEIIRPSGLIPDAEFVALEIVLETFATQPDNVQAVFRAFVEECVDVTKDPAVLPAVIEYRRQHYRGVFEHVTPTAEPAT